MRITHHNQIFIGMVLGVVIGMALWWYAESAATSDRALSGVYHTVMWALDLLGPTLFIGALKMIIAPLILASIVAGVTSLPNMKELGSIGWKTLAYYFVTTTIAVIIGLVTVLTALLFGLVPALRGSRVDLTADLREGSRGMAGGKRSTRVRASDRAFRIRSAINWLSFVMLCIQQAFQACQLLFD